MIRAGWGLGAVVLGYALSGCAASAISDGETTQDAGGTQTSARCEPGAESCSCYGNGTCDGALTCLSTRCVDISELSVADNETSRADAAVGDQTRERSSTSDTPSYDVTESDAMGHTAEQPSSEVAVTGDGTDIAQEDTAADASALAATMQTSMIDESSIADAGVTEPSPVQEASTGAPASCEPSGSCAQGDGLDCVDEQPVARECAGCAVLSGCSDCCNNVGYLAATVEPAAPLPELVNDFSQSSAGVVLSLDFTAAGQTGDISFQLDSALTIDPVAIAITLDPSGEATGPLSLTLEDNSAEDSGCAYQLTTLGGDYIVYDLIRCWGEFKADSVPTSVRTITVRAEANASGHSKLWVSRIDW